MDYHALNWLHGLCAALAIGGDLARVLASRWLIDARLAPEARALAARLLDLQSRWQWACVVLLLPSGLTLAWRSGWLVQDAQGILAFWAYCAGWGWIAHRVHVGPAAVSERMRQLDTLLPLALMLGLGWMLLRSALGHGPIQYAPWLWAKTAIYIGILGLLLWNQRQSPTITALATRLQASAPDVAAETALRRSVRQQMARSAAIWLGLALSMLLGLGKWPA